MKITRRQLRQLIKEAVDAATDTDADADINPDVGTDYLDYTFDVKRAEPVAEEALARMGITRDYKIYNAFKTALVRKMLEQPELVQQLVAAIARGSEAVREFIESLDILGD